MGERQRSGRTALAALCLGCPDREVEADLSDIDVPRKVFAEVNERLGSVQALVMSHCDGADAGIPDTTVEDFDRCMAVNARASWLLVQ